MFMPISLHPFGIVLHRAAQHLPSLHRQQGRPATLTPASGWLQRLADWSDRQPPHHHLGSYTRLGSLR